MAALNLVINYIYRGIFLYIDNINNNFITTLLLVVFIIFLIDKNDKRYYIGFGIWQVLSTLLIFLLVDFINVSFFSSGLLSYMLYGSLLGNVIFTEGGVLFVVLGVILYLTRNSRVNLIIYYSGFSILTYLLVRKYGYYRSFISALLPFADYQWMMIAALPLMLLYNRKKGAGLKYLFYIFYPLHIVVLFIIGNILD